MKESPVYKQYRIHTERLPSGLWLVQIVNVGSRKMPTKDSLTDAVMRIPGEYDSEEAAIGATKEYIDQKVRHEQQLYKHTAPAPTGPDRGTRKEG